MIAAARAAGLAVHVYTVRAEDPYLALAADGGPLDAEAEVAQLFALGVTGVFADHPDVAVRARDALRANAR
jgi:glycerophosphoryl diester phosphodiesterase